MTEPLVIVDSTVVAIAPKVVGAYRPSLLGRISELLAHGRLSEEYGVLSDTDAMYALGLLRFGGFQVAVYRPGGEQATGMLFWGHGHSVTTAKWGELLQRNPGATYISTPERKRLAPRDIRHRFIIAGALGLNLRHVSAAANLLGRSAP